MTWAARPAEPAFHIMTATELATILDRVESLSNCDGINNVGGAGTSTSASYANMAGTSVVNLTKKETATRLFVGAAITSYSTATATTQDTAVAIAGTDYQIMSFSFSTANKQDFQVGYRYISSIAAGAVTVQLRWKRNAGAGTLTTDTFSWISLFVAECG